METPHVHTLNKRDFQQLPLPQSSDPNTFPHPPPQNQNSQTLNE